MVYKINITLHILAINILITLTMHPKIDAFLLPPRKPRMPLPLPFPHYPYPNSHAPKKPTPRNPVQACRAHLALLTRACSTTPIPPVMQLAETPISPPVPAPVMAPAPAPSEGGESVPGGGHNPTGGHNPSGGHHATGGHHPFGGHHQQGGLPSNEPGIFPAGPDGECCRLLTAVEDACVCSVLSHLPVFLSKPTHHFTVTVGDMCQVTFGCVSRRILDD